MFITQLSVFVENNFGTLSEILDILHGESVNIRALCMAETADYGILRLIVDDTEKAKKILKENGVVVRTSEVLSLPIPDRPGGLAELIHKFSDAKISIEYLYAFVDPEHAANVILRVDQPEKAGQIFYEEQYGI